MGANNSSWVQLGVFGSFVKALFLVVECERALDEDPWHKLVLAEWAPVEYIREEVWMDQYITEQKGNCASAGALEQDRLIAQPLSQ